MNGFQWFLPSWYGDIRLRVVDDHHTRVEVTSLTRGELAAMHALKKRSLQGGIIRRPWATERAWEQMPDEAFVVGSGRVHGVTLRAPITTIEKFLTRQMRGKDETVSVMITDKGNLYEIKMPDSQEEETNVLPFRREGGQEEPEAATTVRKPAVGCPAPDFQQAHVRAAEVLRTFLTPQQVRDFQRHQRFVTVGAETGHRYMITSRHARSELSNFTRTVYDIDEEKPYCVHDWGVPAAEEMLTMHLMLSLPRWEHHVRGLREDGTDVHTWTGPASNAELAPPPAHFYYDLNGCLRPFDEYEGHFVGKDGGLKYCTAGGEPDA